MSSSTSVNSSPTFHISGSVVIITEKFNGENYVAWADSVELWFLGQGYHEHLEKIDIEGSVEQQAQWKRLDFQLCTLLYESVEPKILRNFRACKTCYSFWKKAQDIYSNDIQHLFNCVQKLASLKQNDSDMVSYVSKARAAVEELKLFLEADSIEEIRKRLDNLYMVMILRGMNLTFNHIRDQILTGQDIPSMESLTTRLLRVPILSNESTSLENNMESFVMISSRGRGGRGNRRHGNRGRGGRGNRLQCTHCKRMGHTHETCYSLHGFPDKSAHVLRSEKPEERKLFQEEYQGYQEDLKMKSNSLAGPSSSSGPNVSTACISQSVEGQNPWIDHISGGAHFLEDESTKIFARKVADHYSARSNQTLEEQEASPIIHLKKLNNWIKSVLIQLYARRGDAVVDLACGKGGDLIKWDKAKIGYYVGIDIADGSIKDCRTHYNGDADHHQRWKRFTFPARLICGDCYEVRVDKVLADDAPFDICSCQFALHYSWSTEARARQALANVSALLRPGGIFIGTMPDANVIIKKLREAEGLTFGNSVYWVCFDEEFFDKKFKSSSPFGIKYTFHLEDAVDCPEWIVPFDVFKSLAEEYDFELVFAKNSHEFVHEYMKKSEFVELMRRLGALGDGNQDQSTLSADEWEAAYLYMSFVLRKRGQPDKSQSSARRDRGSMHISEEDIMYISTDY